MTQQKGLRRGMVLEPVVQPGSERRICVLLDDVADSPVRLQIGRQSDDGTIQMSGQELMVPPSALDTLRPINGMFMEL